MHFASCFVFFTLSGEVVYQDWITRTFTPRMHLFLPVAFFVTLVGVGLVATRSM